MNLELWEEPGTGHSIMRLSARPDPYEESFARKALEEAADLLQPWLLGRDHKDLGLDADSYTWVSSSSWTVEPDSINLNIAELDAALQKAPAGLCNAKGKLVCDASQGATHAIVDAPRKLIYVSYDYLTSQDDVSTVKIVEGCQEIPLTSIPELQVMKRGRSPHAMALSPNGATLATLEIDHSIERDRGYITLFNTRSFEERRLTWLPDIGGEESLDFSPDGRWLLLSHPGIDRSPVVIDTEDGTHQIFETITNPACWWARNGHLGLLVIGTSKYDSPDYDPYVIRFLDLTEDSWSEIIRVTPPDFIAPGKVRFTGAKPHGDGRILLRAPIPPANDNYSRHNSLAILDLRSGKMMPAVKPFAGPKNILVKHQQSWCWNSPLELNVVERPRVLEAETTSQDLSEWPNIEDKFGVLLRVEFDSPFVTGSFIGLNRAD